MRDLVFWSRCARRAVVETFDLSRNWRWMLAAPVCMGGMGLVAGLLRLGSQPATLNPAVIGTMGRAALTGFVVAVCVVFVARLVRMIRRESGV